ncbi:hypothetical protein [Polaribacter sp.]|uniref:hypothetical protein n=1 Tax=Polaribacter sp. TaxID=1920175 RepID=UPI003F6A72FE
MRSRIVGTEFNPSEAKEIQEGSQITISHEPYNQFDSKALVVLFNDEKIGYISKTDDIYDIERINFPITGKVVDFYIKDESDTKFKKHLVNHLVSCTIEIADRVELKKEDNVKSFNEEGVIINFNEDTHTYTNPITKEFLIGATTYVKKYIQKFPSHALQNCIKYWKLEKEIIQGAWDLSRDCSASFGTSIHKALEFSDLYGSYKKPKDGSRCFQIKHPMLKRIVKEFYELNDKLGFEGDVIPEALITDVENNHCALGDRVLVTSWENKTCRLQDYKVNIKFTEKGEVKWTDLMPLNLPTTKLSKLALQLKFQAQMLEKSGWTIEGCDGFVYAERGWEHHEVDMLHHFNIITGELEV